MVHPLYYVLDLIFALLLIIILHHGKKYSEIVNSHEKAFRLLIKWVVFFCVQDAVWGYCASDAVHHDMPLFISSSVFHLSTVTTTFFWLYYILRYLDNHIRHPRLLLRIDGVVVAIQVLMVFTNFIYPIIFTVSGGAYITCYLRPLAFFNQYVVYLAICIIALISVFSDDELRRQKYINVFLFSLAPVLSGVFQLLYPDGPFYAMGYFLGCFIIHMYVVTSERDELKRVQASHALDEQVRISNTDELTGLSNRRSYETDISESSEIPAEENFVYFSIDINGLKQVNDNLGHQAGDELIIGAASCIRKCLGAYGRTYRIGGDEFAAIIYASETELQHICEDLEETILRWKGTLVGSLAMSFGYASKREYPTLTISKIANIADERMYAEKEIYYSQKGIDRRGQQSAFAALCSSYTKILRINLTTDKYHIIRMQKSEQTSVKGFAPFISKWLHDFAVNGQVHPDDQEHYLELTDLASMKRFFSNRKSNLNILYRRKSDIGWRQTKMELIPAEDYRDDNMSLYLFVKDIEQ